MPVTITNRTVAGLVLTGVAFATGMAHAQMPAAMPKFEVATVKPCNAADVPSGGRGGGGGRVTWSPGRLNAACQTVADLIRWAYLLNASGKPWPNAPTTGLPIRPVSSRALDQPIKGSPPWVNSDRFTIESRGEETQPREMMRGPMMQRLLEDRFKLKLHSEAGEIPVYELTVAKGGPKLQPAKPGGCVPIDMNNLPDPKSPGALCGMVKSSAAKDALDMAGVMLDDVCRQFSFMLDRDLIDRTGIKGVFDIHLELDLAGIFPRGPEESGDPASQGASIDPAGAMAAAFQKLGLKLAPAKGSAELLVIDHVERPSEN